MNNKLHEKTATKLFMVLLMTVIAITPVATLLMPSQQGTTQLSTATMEEPQVATAPPTSQNWSYTTGDGVLSSPAVADVDEDGQLEVVIGSDDGKIYCLNSTGGKEWDYSTIYTHSCPSVADVDGDGHFEILVGSYGDNKVYCLNVTGGTPNIQWSYTTGGAIYSSPCVADVDNDFQQEVLVGSQDNKTYCLTKNGLCKWSYTTGYWVFSSPCVADIDGDGALEVLFGSRDKCLYCLNSTGYLRWRYNTTGPIFSSPCVADIDHDGSPEVLIGSDTGKVYCLNVTAGTPRLQWSYTTGNVVRSSPCVADLEGDGKLEVLVGSLDWKLYCLNSTGASKWICTADGLVNSSPCVADVDGDGHLEVLVGSYDSLDPQTLGFLWCLNYGGGYKWAYTTGGGIGSSPCAVDIDGDGQLQVLFASEDKSVYCISVAGAPVNPSAFPWPSICFRGDIRRTGLYTDADHDNLTDNYETIIGTNPNSIDTDGDRLTDYQEFIFSTNPLIDSVKPSTITNLLASIPAGHTITLTWTAPGGNGHLDLAAGYIVKYSTTGQITDLNWSSAMTYAQTWTPLTPGSTEERSVSGLNSETRYWFAVKAFDGVPNYGDISNSPSATTLDVTPPATITDLAVIAFNATSVMLSWTAPGDDGTLGTATSYVVRYFTGGNITDWNSTMSTYVQSWTPLSAGSNETHILTGLTSGTSYWFAVMAYDEANNHGGVSNSPTVTTSSTGGAGETGAMPPEVIYIVIGSVAAVVVVVSIIILKKRK
jgi:hypothetical protein